MSSLLDEKGRLFGRVNLVDGLTVVAILLLILGGMTLLEQGYGKETTVVNVESAIPQYHADAINDSKGPVDEGVVSVGDVRVKDHYFGEAQSGHNRTILLVGFRATLLADSGIDGLVFRGERLYVGRSLTLDLNTTIVDADVVSIQRGGGDG